MFANPDDLDMLHPQLKAELATDKVVLAVLSVRVRDLADAGDWLDKAGIPYKKDSSSTIGVRSEHVHGVMLEFTG